MTCDLCGRERPIVGRVHWPKGTTANTLQWCGECDEAAREAAEEWRMEQDEKATTTIYPDIQQHEDAEKLPAVRILQVNRTPDTTTEK